VQVMSLDLDENDRFLIIASDGLWENMESAQLLSILEDALFSQVKGAVDNIPAALVQQALERAAVRHNVRPPSLHPRVA
jgi:serine/threonine protein phosphatase PrpC